MPVMPDDEYLSPLEGPVDPDATFLTVECQTPGCRMSFFVAKNHPLLPDGPWICPDHCDTQRPLTLERDAVAAIVTCDRCPAELTTQAKTREQAIEKLRAAIIEHKWEVVDRFDVDQRDGAAINDTRPDLCSDCAAGVA